MDYQTEWADQIPEEGVPADTVPQFQQHIYEHWKREEGPCEGCNNRVFKERCHPDVGKGSVDADVMLVGSAPGPRNREIEVDNQSRKIDPLAKDDLPDFDGYPLYAFYGTTIEDMNEWSGISTLRSNLIEDERGLNVELGDLYFTNARKCPDISGYESGNASRRCASYLQTEIDLVRPQVIVTFGRSTAIAVARCLEYDESKFTRRTMEIMTGAVTPTCEFIGYHETDPYLISMPHWAGLGRNLNRIPHFDPSDYEHPEKEIYYQLADLITYILQ